MTLKGSIKTYPPFTCLFFKRGQSLLALSLKNLSLFNQYLLRGYLNAKGLVKAVRRNPTKSLFLFLKSLNTSRKETLILSIKR